MYRATAYCRVLKRYVFFSSLTWGKDVDEKQNPRDTRGDRRRVDERLPRASHDYVDIIRKMKRCRWISCVGGE